MLRRLQLALWFLAAMSPLLVGIIELFINYRTNLWPMVVVAGVTFIFFTHICTNTRLRISQKLLWLVPLLISSGSIIFWGYGFLSLLLFIPTLIMLLYCDRYILNRSESGEGA